MHRYTILDVFTDVPLTGNSVAVFADGSDLDGELMQRVAREMNLSETVFLLEPEDAGTADARVRIFTPGTELPFAGHPVLGTAFVVGEKLGIPTVRLQTAAGVVPIVLTREDGRIVYGEMDQPLPALEPFAEADRLLEALGVARSELPVECYRNGPQHVYVSLADQESVSALRPDMTALAELGMFGVNCFAGTNGHYLTRMFAPALGIAEDPATGSAAGPLAVHLARHGRIAFGIDIEIRQGVEMGRPSLLYARVEGTPDRLERVVVGGSAVAVASGEYRFH
ncbi:MAG: PhzF family phenazine biosynthesis protein [Actinomycetota bacterium]|nr:PhzF family phenazine biosynthesis protein [Actinomycetota bacterium]